MEALEVPAAIVGPPWASPYPYRILRYLSEREQAYPPSVREVMAAVGLRSPNTVLYWYVELRDAGLVLYEDGLRRTIRLTVAGALAAATSEQ